MGVSPWCLHPCQRSHRASLRASRTTFLSLMLLSHYHPDPLLAERPHHRQLCSPHLQLQLQLQPQPYRLCPYEFRVLSPQRSLVLCAHNSRRIYLALQAGACAQCGVASRPAQAPHSPPYKTRTAPARLHATRRARGAPVPSQPAGNYRTGARPHRRSRDSTHPA